MHSNTVKSRKVKINKAAKIHKIPRLIPRARSSESKL